jgi:hypothetical protein
MKHTHTFFTAMLTSAGIFCAGVVVVGSGETDITPDTRLLAHPRGTVQLEDCMVSGRIEASSNGVFAVFSIENPAPADKELQFHYLAARTPATTPLSRMAPFPLVVSNGLLTVRAPQGSTRKDVLLTRQVPRDDAGFSPTNRPALAGSTNAVRLAIGTPESWTLIVSRTAIKTARGWGAVLPVPSGSDLNLDKGEAVLASTPLEKKDK